MPYFSEILYKEYSKIKPSERKCLTALAEKWQKEKPYAGKKILLNCHITRSTLIMIDILLLAGADVNVTATDELAIHKSILKKIKKAGITYFQDSVIPEDKQTDYFDILFDCGAGLLHKVKPKLGTAELTCTDRTIYDEINHPVITVDLTHTKAIETYYGTGDALVRVLKTELPKDKKYNKDYAFLVRIAELFGDNEPEAKQDLLKKAEEKWFFQKSYVIFGYGKVGRGIADALLNAGVKPENIIIIDKSYDACKKAHNGKNFQSFLLNEENLPKIKEQIKSSFCVITSTGIKNAISNNFEKQDFPEHLLKINMGTPDEWGYKFSESEVMNEKKPANFLMEYPTEVAYLDPIFISLLRAGEILVHNYAVSSKEKFTPGLHPLPKEIDSEIAKDWQRRYRNTRKSSVPLWEIVDDISILLTPTSSPSNSDSDSDSDIEQMNNYSSAHSVKSTPILISPESSSDSEDELQEVTKDHGTVDFDSTNLSHSPSRTLFFKSFEDGGLSPDKIEQIMRRSKNALEAVSFKIKI